MSKRFIDTDLWDKTKFNACSQKIKLLSIFMSCKCDLIGVFRMAPMLINAYIGEPVTEEEILSVPMDICRLGEGVYWLEKFCSFQYGELSKASRPHKKYIKMLKDANLLDRVSNRVSDRLSDSLKDKEEEQDKDKDKEEEKDKEEIKEPFPTSINPLETEKPKNRLTLQYMEIYATIKSFNQNEVFGKIQNAIFEAVADCGNEHLLQTITDFAFYVNTQPKEKGYAPSPINWLSTKQYKTDWLIRLESQYDPKQIPEAVWKTLLARQQKYPEMKWEN